MIDLHEKLSEFSYGYGLTREVEKSLESVGIKAAPFMPSLLHEKSLGFDVGFKRPGAALLLQFKLGHELQRFHRTSSSQTIPALTRPFWRFFVDTTEDQFRRLYDLEIKGAEVHYVAPRFTDWPEYEKHFTNQAVLEKSLLITPTMIINATSASSSKNRVVYDDYHQYVCSEPRRVERVRFDEVQSRLSEKISMGIPLETVVRRLSQRREDEGPQERLSRNLMEAIQSQYGDRTQANAVQLGMEAWLTGGQLFWIAEK